MVAKRREEKEWEERVRVQDWANSAKQGRQYDENKANCEGSILLIYILISVGVGRFVVVSF